MPCRIQRRSQRLVLVALATSVLLAASDGLVDERVRTRAGAAPERSGRAPVVHVTNVTGTITSVGGDASGPERAVAIVSPERRVYLVGDDRLGRRLGNLVGKTVSVTAEVKRDADGWPYLAVESFRVLEG